jgi:hypothetical protein
MNPVLVALVALAAIIDPEATIAFAMVGAVVTLLGLGLEALYHRNDRRK